MSKFDEFIRFLYTRMPEEQVDFLVETFKEYKKNQRKNRFTVMDKSGVRE